MSCVESDAVAEFLNSGVKVKLLREDGEFDTERRVKDESEAGVDRSDVGDGSGDSNVLVEEGKGDGRQIELEQGRPWVGAFEPIVSI